MKKLILLVLLLIIYSCDDNFVNFSGHAEYGYLTVTSEDLTKKNIPLKCRWEFYWNQMLLPDDFSNQRLSPNYVRVPSYWTSYTIWGKKPSLHGHATYRLLIKTGEMNDEKYENLKIYMHTPISASNIYINGEYVDVPGQASIYSRNEVPYFGPIILDCAAKDGIIEILIHVSNHNYITPGIIKKIVIGSDTNITKYANTKLILNVFLFASILLFGIIHFIFYLFRREEIHYLWFAVFSFSIAVWTMLTNERFILQMINHYNWFIFMKINLSFIIISPAILIKYLSSIYKSEFINFINNTLYLVSFLVFCISLFTSTIISSQLLKFFHVFIIIFAVYIIISIFRAILRKKRGARLTLIGLVFLLTASLADILSVYVPTDYPFFVPSATFLFFFIQSFTLAKKNARNVREIEQFSSTLERKIELRTKELQREKKKLEKKNMEIEEDLLMARKMQQNMVSHKISDERIAAIYKPMMQVGGDFFDFIHFEDEDKLGVFVCDVSGHGVTAALITSMLKSIVLQSKKYLKMPSGFLSHINKILFEQTNNNFITAFYGIIDFKNRAIEYSSAGHPMPIYLKNNESKELPGKKGVPLAICDDKELKDINKPYITNKLDLDGVSHIFLFTDGIIEATSQNDSNLYFENYLLTEVLTQCSGLEPYDFLDYILTKLVKFHGSAEFNDDICLICISTK